MRVRLIAPGALLSAGLILHPMSLGRLTPFVIVTGAVAFAGFIAALATGRWSLGGAAAGCYLAQYTTALILVERVDIFAPIAALGLFLLLEMIDSSRVMARGVIVEPEVIRGHVRATALTAALGGIAATGVLLGGTAGRGGGALALVIGAGCLLGAVVLGVGAARRGTHGA
jgi:hypothetical protein